MAERSSSNVVSLWGQDTQADRSSAHDPQTLLRESRDRLINGLSTAFAQHIGHAKDACLEMADRTTSADQRQHYLEAVQLLGASSQRLLQEYRDQYTRQFDESIAKLRSERRHSAQITRLSGELSLVDHDEFERDLAIGKLSARATLHCTQQLIALEHRLSALLRIGRLSQEDNPLYPRMLFSAMLDALQSLDAGAQPSLILVQEFERQTTSELPGIYADLNRYLIDAGILPEIPLSDSLPVRERTSGATSGAAPQTADASQEQTFLQLAQVLQAGITRYHSDVVTPLSLSNDAATTDAGTSALLNILDQVQHAGKVIKLPSRSGSSTVDPAGAEALHQIRAASAVHDSHPIDALTIDIVTMLFGTMLDDPQLSAPMRAELARLQIPILKVALLDKNFFSDRQHPARQLLALFSSSMIGRHPEEEAHQIETVRSIIDTIVETFDTDTAIFSVQARKLEDFLKEEEQRSAHKNAEALMRERRAIADSRIQHVLAPHLAAPDLPLLIADFLDRYWREVLINRFVAHGEESDEWRDAVSLMDDLAWSVHPKQSAAERERLLTSLSKLVPRLRTGLGELKRATDHEPFFGALLRLHMRVLNQNPTGTDTTPPRQTSAAPSAPRTTETPAAPKQRAEVAPSKPQSAPADDGDEFTQLAQSLEVGAWVEFQSARGKHKTLRLSWVSQFRGVYSFTNRQGDNAMTLAATSLASHLRKGTARIIDD